MCLLPSAVLYSTTTAARILTSTDGMRVGVFVTNWKYVGARSWNAQNSDLGTDLRRYRSSTVLRNVERDTPPAPEFHTFAWRSDCRKAASPPSQKRSRSAAKGAGYRTVARSCVEPGEQPGAAPLKKSANVAPMDISSSKRSLTSGSASAQRIIEHSRSWLPRSETSASARASAT